MSRRCLSHQALLVRKPVLRNRCGTHYFSHRQYGGGVATHTNPAEQSTEYHLNKREFMREEKDKIEAMLAKDHTWNSIANALPGRTQRTLMDHYKDYMFTPGELTKARPSAEKTTLPETHWSLEEDCRILDMLAEKQSWGMIAEALPSKTAQSIELRYGQGLCKLERPRNADAKPRGIHSKPSSVERSQQPLDRRSPLDAQARRNFTTIHCRTAQSQVATLLPHDPLPVVNGRSWIRCSLSFPQSRWQRRIQSTSTAFASPTKKRGPRGPKPMTFTEEQDAQMIDSHAAGDAFRETALLFGISKGTARTRIQSLLSQEKWLRRYEAGKNHLAAKRCRFTAQEDAKLILLRKAGRSFRQIAGVLRRNLSSITTRWYLISTNGLGPERTSSWSHEVSPRHERGESPWVGNNCRFNAQEDAEIIKMRKAGATFRDIAIALKRRPGSVWKRWDDLLSGSTARKSTPQAGELLSLSKNAYSKFTAQEDAVIIKMREAGATFQEIALALKRNRRSVSTRFYDHLSGSHAEKQPRRVSRRTLVGGLPESLPKMTPGRVDVTHKLIKDHFGQSRGMSPRTPKPWSESELEILRSAIGTSRFHPKLALLLPGRPKHVIRAKLKEEKLLRSKATGGASEEHGSEH